MRILADEAAAGRLGVVPLVPPDAVDQKAHRSIPLPRLFSCRERFSERKRRKAAMRESGGGFGSPAMICGARLGTGLGAPLVPSSPHYSARTSRGRSGDREALRAHLRSRPLRAHGLSPARDRRAPARTFLHGENRPSARGF